MKFCGFYRLRNSAPAPVIPLFTDGSVVFRQVIDEKDRVSKFVVLANYDDQRLFIANEIKIAPPAAGDNAIFSYEYAEKSVAVGDLESLKARLRHIVLNTEYLASNDFARFDIASFVGDEDIIISAGKRCYAALSHQSSELGEKWLSGAPIGTTLMRSIRDGVQLRHVSPDDYEITVTYKKVVMLTIELCALRLGESRYEYIARAVEKYFTRLSEDSELAFTETDFRYVKKLFFDEGSKVYSSFRDLTASTINDVRIIIDNSKVSLNRDVLEHLIVSEISELCYMEKKIFKIRIASKNAANYLDVVKRFGRFNAENRGAIILLCLNHSDPEFFSKIHMYAKKRAKRPEKNPRVFAKRLLNKYAKYAIS